MAHAPQNTKRSKSCDLLQLLQGLTLGPPGPKKWAFGASRPQGSKEVEKSQRRVQKSKEVKFGHFRRFFDFFDPQGQETLGTHFRTFFRLWVRRAQMTPVAGEEDLKAKVT